MLILDENNQMVDIDQISKNKEVHYAVLDFSKPRLPDYFFRPIIFIDTYTAPAAMLQIGPYKTLIPFKWSIVVTYADIAELVAIEDIVSRDHEAFCINPITGYMPSRLPIRYKGSLEVSWSYPTLGKSDMLVIPIAETIQKDDEKRRGPICILAGERIKIPETIDLSLLW